MNVKKNLSYTENINGCIIYIHGVVPYMDKKIGPRLEGLAGWKPFHNLGPPRGIIEEKPLENI